MKGARGRERDLLIRESALLERVRNEMEGGNPLASQSLTSEESGILANYNLLGHKPIMPVYNISEDAAAETQPDADPITICAGLEWELAQLPPEDEREFASLWASKTPAKTYFWPKP